MDVCVAWWIGVLNNKSKIHIRGNTLKKSVSSPLQKTTEKAGSLKSLNYDMMDVVGFPNRVH